MKKRPEAFVPGRFSPSVIRISFYSFRECFSVNHIGGLQEER